MAAEKLCGEFSSKITSLIFTPGPANSVFVQVNVEGTAPGSGMGLSTGTFAVGKSGTFNLCAAAYLDNGDIQTFPGQGTFESSGPHTWRTQHVSQSSDGRTVDGEREIDLAARMRSWKFVERS